MSKHYNPWQERFDAVCKNWEKMSEQTKANATEPAKANEPAKKSA